MQIVYTDLEAKKEYYIRRLGNTMELRDGQDRRICNLVMTSVDQYGELGSLARAFEVLLGTTVKIEEMQLDDVVNVELSKELAWDLLQSVTHLVTLDMMPDLTQRCLGLHPIDRGWMWNEQKLKKEPAVYMYNLYKEIKTGKHEPEQ